MVMDPGFSELSDVLNGFEFGDELVSPGFDRSLNTNGFKFEDESLDLSILDIPIHPPDPDPRNFTPSSGSSETNSSDDSLFSDGVLKFLNQILMEDKIEEKPCMFHDPLALQEAEKSFYEVLGKEYPASSQQPLVDVNHTVESPNSYFLGSSNSISSSGNDTDTQWVGDSLYYRSTLQNYPLEYLSSSVPESSMQLSLSSVESINNIVSGPINGSANPHLVQNIFNDSESILQFNRGMEEANKFLPNSTQLVIDLDNYALPSDKKESQHEVEVEVEKDTDTTLNSSRGRKHYQRQDSVVIHERNKKHSAVYVEEETELLEMFDRVLLSGPPEKKEAIVLHENGKAGRNAGKSRSKKKGSMTKAVDLTTLLISCAQSVAAGDSRTVYEQLKQIRQHSSASGPSGDATQRLADVFANGLEARMAGTGTKIYASLANKKISAAQKLKAYEVYISASPFKYISMYLMNKMILDMASNATTLHIIDFGIQYGFQWPMLIKLLSKRFGGPPKLRITGIEFPQPGFRPAERVDDTGRRLTNYCERFEVPFEYNAITTQKWETVRKQDLNIESNEVVAVNCLYRFKNLLDETVVLDSPRDAVLKLIRKLNPNIFVQGVVNGCYNAPFFVTRFREALFHYSALFDMFDNTIPRENMHRLDFEREFYGRECINVIACEGLERVDRPETYKQWQVRNMRAGFRQLPLDRELLKSLRSKVKSGYHSDFVVDEDSNWLLQGWKGRILNAVSCWIPA